MDVFSKSHAKINDQLNDFEISWAKNANTLHGKQTWVSTLLLIGYTPFVHFYNWDTHLAGTSAKERATIVWLIALDLCLDDLFICYFINIYTLGII